MIHIEPIVESASTENTAAIYIDIASTLKLHRSPVFFRMIANFEDYLSFIWEKIKPNLVDPEFNCIVDDLDDFILRLLEDVYVPSDEAKSFLQEYVADFHSKRILSQEIEKVNHVSSQMAIVFIAVREAVKGWAIGAKKIAAESPSASRTTREEKVIKKGLEDFREDFGEPIPPDLLIQTNTKNIISQPGNSITVSVYARFLSLISSEMEQLIRKKEYLYRRVEIEKYVLAKIHLIPHPLESSYNTVASYAAKYPFFNELLYLLSEDFPTQAVIRVNTAILAKILLR